MSEKEDLPRLSCSSIIVEIVRDGFPVRLFDDISFSVFAGETIDITGPSGSGKSTLLRVLTRMQPVVSAVLMLENRPADEIPVQEWRTEVALVPQVPVVIDATVQENLLLPWTLSIKRDVPRPSDEELRDLLDRVLLNDISLSSSALRLSIGQMARLSLLRVLITRPHVLLLDEADAALDHESAEAVSHVVQSYIDQTGMPCLRVRHRENDGFANARFEIRNGRLERKGIK